MMLEIDSWTIPQKKIVLMTLMALIIFHDPCILACAWIASQKENCPPTTSCQELFLFQAVYTPHKSNSSPLKKLMVEELFSLG